MSILQPHRVPGPAAASHVRQSCSAGIRKSLAQCNIQRAGPCADINRRQPRSSSTIPSASQGQAELADHPNPDQNDILQIDATIDALLTGEGEAEGEELPEFDVLVAEQQQQQQIQQEQNPYSPADAASTARSWRFGAPQPAAPELEQFLAAAAADGGNVTMQQLQALFPFKLDGFQERSIEQLLQGRSVVVCAPTGAGKTAIAEAAAAATLTRGRRVIYTTPLKALSNQKLAEKSARFGSNRCGLQTGDTSLNTEADIVVMTTEILRNIMYRTAETVGANKVGATRDERLGDVGLIVLDEVHYLGDPWRGSVWEEVIINCPRHIQILAMSATVKNPDDLGGWISAVHGDCVTIKTRFRPVPLQWVFCNKVPRRGTVFDDLLVGGNKHSNSSSGQGMRLNPRLRIEDWVEEELRYQAARDARAARQQALPQQGEELLAGADPVDDLLAMLANGEDLKFDVSSSGNSSSSNGSGGGRFKRKENDRVAVERRVMAKRTPAHDQVIRQLQQHKMLPAIWFIMSRRDCDYSAINSNVTLVNQDEEAQLVEELQDLYADNPDAVRVKLVPALLRGVSSHHAGCLPAWKSLVERCFQKGLLKLVFATGTLAAGINMPARTTVISNLARKSDAGVQVLSHNELLQMAGRAGRRGYDTLGHCVIVQGRYEGAGTAHQIITSGPEPLLSQFTTSYSLVLNLCSVYSLDEAREFLSKSFGTYLLGEGTRSQRQEAHQLIQAATQLVKIAKEKGVASEAQKAAAVEVKKHKGTLLKLRDRATQERCAAVRQLLAGQQQQQDDIQQQTDASASQQDDTQQQQQQQYTAGLPALLLLNLNRHPNDETQPAQLLPALAVKATDTCPLPPTSTGDMPEAPIIICLGADNRPMAVSAQHVVGVVNNPQILTDVLHGQEDTLHRLRGILDDAAQNPKVWANLASKMFSCQVTFGSTLTSALAVRLNLPPDSFKPVDPAQETLDQIDHQILVLRSAKQKLQEAQQLEKEQQGQIDPEEVFATLAESVSAASSSSSSSSSSGNGNGAPAAAVDDVLDISGKELAAAAAYKALKAGADPLNVAKRMMRKAKKVLAETDEGSETTWNSFMDVLGILVELNAMEANTLRLLPLGRVARSINCNNELWMSAALSHPCVMDLTPPQLAAFVGALQCTDLLKRPMSIWSSYQVSDAVVSAVEQLEPTMESIYQAQTAAGQTRWNEHLAVDLRLAGLVEAWAGGASWQEIMADTSIDDGDMARLLARTADMLKQITFLNEELPQLIDTARAALRGMDRKPISDLVA